MRVGEVLNHLYFLSYVIIKQGCGTGEPEIHYKGTVLDIPWWIANMELDTDEEGGAIDVGLDKFKEGEGDQPCFIIYVKDPA